MLEAVGSIYYLFNDLVFFLALFVVQGEEGDGGMGGRRGGWGDGGMGGRRGDGGDGGRRGGMKKGENA